MREHCFCTIVTASHLRYALALGASLKRHHPESGLHVLLLDPSPATKAIHDPYVHVTTLDELQVPGTERLRVIFDAFALSNNLKPLWIKHLVREVAAKVVYLDSDVLVVGRFDTLLNELDDAWFALTPHLLRAEQAGSSSVSIDQLLELGVYNGGMWGLRRCARSDELLEWLAGYLLNTEVPFADQKVLSLASQLFSDGFRQIKDPGYNIAYWNIHERAVERRGGSYVVDGKAVTFFHLSGFDGRHPHRFSKHRDVSLGQLPCRDDIIAEYLSLIPQSPELMGGGYPYDVRGTYRLTPRRRRHFAKHGSFEGYWRRRVLDLLGATRRAVRRQLLGE